MDTFRWYICHDAIFGGDLSFSKMGLVLTHNADLCKTFGNLVHRSLSLMDKYNDGDCPGYAIYLSRFLVPPTSKKHRVYIRYLTRVCVL